MNVLLDIERKPFWYEENYSYTYTLSRPTFKQHGITFGQFSQSEENAIRINFVNFNILFFNGLVHSN